MCTCFLKFSGNDCVWTTDRVADVLVLRQQQRRLVSVRRLGWYGQISFPKLMSSFSGPTFLVGRESLESACGFFSCVTDENPNAAQHVESLFALDCEPVSPTVEHLVS